MSWQKVARRIRVPLGFVFAIVFVVLARPTVHSLLWSLLLVVAGVWLRAYASGYVKKNTELTQTGPYAHTRNPLYLGSMMIAYGFAAASRSIWVTIALTALFLLIYWPTIRSEEQFLRGAFPEFTAYTKRVPRLFPRPWPTSVPARYSADPGRFSAALYRKHREYNALVGSLAIYVVLMARMYIWPSCC